MNKKIALLLILFMVGSWCVFADDGDSGYTEEDEGLPPGVILLIGVGVILLIGGGIAIFLAAKGDHEGAQRVMDSLSTEGNTTIMQNPLIKYAEIGINNNKVYLGTKFSW